MNTIIVKKNLLGIKISDTTLGEVSEYVIDFVKSERQKCIIVTPNPEMIVYCSSHPSFKKLINEATIALCDGVGLSLAAQCLGNPLKERIAGVDMMLELCKLAGEKGLSIGLLGGRGLVAEETAKCLREKYPALKISFTGSEWDVTTFPKQGLDILFVAYGFPKQEEWISHNLPLLPIKVAMGVGGSFDYISGNVARAPFFLRSIGLEWLFRLVRQPWRIKRQLKLFTFVWLVIHELTRVK